MPYAPRVLRYEQARGVVAVGRRERRNDGDEAGVRRYPHGYRPDAGEKRDWPLLQLHM